MQVALAVVSIAEICHGAALAKQREVLQADTMQARQAEAHAFAREQTRLEVLAESRFPEARARAQNSLHRKRKSEVRLEFRSAQEAAVASTASSLEPREGFLVAPTPHNAIAEQSNVGEARAYHNIPPFPFRPHSNPGTSSSPSTFPFSSEQGRLKDHVRFGWRLRL